MATRSALLAMLVALAAGVSCSGRSESSSSPDVSHQGNIIAFDPKSPKLKMLKTTAVKESKLPSELALPAKVEVNPYRSAEILLPFPAKGWPSRSSCR
jgi:hypothetical protein